MTRRSLDDINLTPEEEAFLQSGTATVQKPTADKVPEAESRHASPPKPETSHVFAIDDSPLVSLNTRIPSNLATALLRASMDRKIRKLAPFTQQDLVTRAITDWLSGNGYLQ